MISFKQFLESQEPLEHVHHLMIIRTLIPGLTNSDAQHVLDWLDSTGQYELLPDDVADKVANSELAETDYAGKDLRDFADHKVAPIVRGKIQALLYDAIDDAKIAESADPLKAIEIEMFFRKELDLPKEEAEEAAEWFQHEKDWNSLEPDTIDHIIDYVVAEINANVVNYNKDKCVAASWAGLRDVMNTKYGVAV